jgi:hypothetical protein
MRTFLPILAGLAAAASGLHLPAAHKDSLEVRQNTEYTGYLVSTFSDQNPQVQWHLSNGESLTGSRFLNKGRSILASTVGTRGVRDIFLTTNSARSEFFLIATGKWPLLYRTHSLPALT